MRFIFIILLPVKAAWSHDDDDDDDDDDDFFFFFKYKYFDFDKNDSKPLNYLVLLDVYIRMMMIWRFFPRGGLILTTVSS